VLERLPPRLRRIAFLRAAGVRYRDIGAITGDSPTRVDQLVLSANDRIHEILTRMKEDERGLPPRAMRLRELEDSAPDWITAEVGRPPRVHNRRVASAGRLLAWRRAALAIDDYRNLTGFDASDHALGQRPADPAAARAFDLARRAIEGFHVGRSLGREID
jgi:hypothetical protein